eukprot:s3415_g8.t1
MCLALNSMWGGELHYDGPLGPIGVKCLKSLEKEVFRLQRMSGKLDDFSWSDFFSTRSIDYKGDEVKTARSFVWDNIKHALPAEVGLVPLEEVCTLGAHHYVMHFDMYIKDPSTWVLAKAPRVMVPDKAWAEVCSGLVKAGVCTMLPVEEVFHTSQGPLLNGLFGVSKEEWVGGTEVFRLIMNLIPLNRLAHPLRGDVETLPMWSLMNPYFLQPGDNLLVSSEDVRCFFYTMSVPESWQKYLAFNKQVPEGCLPEHLRGREVYLASRVLPMGFLNSVSLAQHVHRNLSLWSSQHSQDGVDVNPPEGEIRKDRPLTVCNPAWRIYLDNYDLLEKVSALGVGTLEGTLSPAVLALRQEYEVWSIPRNLKKSVSRQLQAEVQGAQVDGAEGVAYPRETKLLKFIESFNQTHLHLQRFPQECKGEVMKLVSLIPLARLDFRVPFHEQVTCSDASSSGGGICASYATSRWGHTVAGGRLRGELPELRQEHQVLTIGLFDGIAALRVASDLLGLHVLGHVSVEKDGHARRVVESHFPEVQHVNDVELVDEAMVREWARAYSQASVVLLGAGPPCQGVSGLNSERKGALRDQRSKLFVHVPRIEGLVRKFFSWCQTHTLMESVASMDKEDRDHMSQAFGAEPWKCDAGTMTWCHRPRLYWLTWELTPMAGAYLDLEACPREVGLYAQQDLETVCKEGWLKVDPSRAFPTFTTSRPRDHPGRKPAGLNQCNLRRI